jgi:hypothetical protein
MSLLLSRQFARCSRWHSLVGSSHELAIEWKNYQMTNLSNQRRTSTITSVRTGRQRTFAVGPNTRLAIVTTTTNARLTGIIQGTRIVSISMELMKSEQIMNITQKVVLYLSANSEYQRFLLMIDHVLTVERFLAVDSFVHRVQRTLIRTNKLQSKYRFRSHDHWTVQHNTFRTCR